MLKKTTLHRLFFALQVEAPWPQELPSGRLLDQNERHLTLAFLGQTDLPQLREKIDRFPPPPFQVGPAAIADSLIFLPPDAPRVVATSVKWLNNFNRVESWQKQIASWLHAEGYPLDARPFLPHITLARAPFNAEEWKQKFSPLPLIVKALHLYESKGQLHYQPVWSIPFALPFEEFEHTADIAFLIRGEDLAQIHLHAQIALSFKHPALVRYFSTQLCTTLDEIIIDLNRMISEIDRDEGSPFKAVSFHGAVRESPQKILEWEMIVDV